MLRSWELLKHRKKLVNGMTFHWDKHFKGNQMGRIHTEKKKYESPEEVQVLKILISTGDSYFKI